MEKQKFELWRSEIKTESTENTQAATVEGQMESMFLGEDHLSLEAGTVRNQTCFMLTGGRMGLAKRD